MRAPVVCRPRDRRTAPAAHPTPSVIYIGSDYKDTKGSRRLFGGLTWNNAMYGMMLATMLTTSGSLLKRYPQFFLATIQITLRKTSAPVPYPTTSSHVGRHSPVEGREEDTHEQTGPTGPFRFPSSTSTQQIPTPNCRGNTERRRDLEEGRGSREQTRLSSKRDRSKH